jgi:aryl-alcohol dehydrogenase-like predicted oxidoreductase
MQSRKFGRTGRSVSEIGFGAWAIGAAWGEVNDDDAVAALHAALDAGVSFLDTADVYGDGRSEKLIARVMKERGGARPFIATKAGRRLPKQTVEGYSVENLTGWIDRSLKYLETDTLDLVQLHCPPTDLYYHPEVFERLDKLTEQGKIRNYGVSVERVEEALKAIEFPGVQSVQIIYNVLRQRPAERFLGEAKRRGVGVLARLPLASGLLAGKMKLNTAFEPSDHRAYNRNGEAFDRGETFSGIDFGLGLELVERLRVFVPKGATLAQWALRWILENEGVTCVIPGAKRPSQVEENAAAAELAAPSPETLAAVRSLYDTVVKPRVHQYW